MSQYFVESKSKQPVFFSFNKIFPHQETDFDLFIKRFQDNFEIEQQENWTQFWEKQGEDLILCTWNEKYKDYLKGEEQDIEKVEETVCYKEDKEILATTSKDSDKNDTLPEKSWNELWQEHRTEIYCEQYLIFTTIYYNYYLDLKRSCETSQSIIEDLDEIKEDEENIQDEGLKLSEELHQLRIFGLPTSFGGKAQNSGKKHKPSKNSIHYSDFYSDSEMENESENDSEIDVITLHSVQQKPISKQKKRRRNRKLKSVPSFILEDKGLLKYWRNRFSLFSRFDDGIRLDRESWFSVTPEKVAKHLAERLKCNIIVDGFCGSGGNVIQFAITCDKVIAIDIDPVKLEMAKHNAAIYNVAHKIEFILGDFLQLAAEGKLKSDIAFLSPPWGGPKYKNKREFDIEKHLLPVKASELIVVAGNVSKNIALFLPRNSNVQQIVKLAGTGNRCEIEHNYLDSRLVALTAMYGEDIIVKKATT